MVASHGDESVSIRRNDVSATIKNHGGSATSLSARTFGASGLGLRLHTPDTTEDLWLASRLSKRSRWKRATTSS